MPAAHAPQRDALTKRAFAAVAVAAVLLSATACSSDGDDRAVITDPPTASPTAGPRLESDSVESALLTLADLEGGWEDKDARQESYAKCVPLIEQFSKVAISGRSKARFKTNRTYLEEIIASFSNDIVAASFMNDVFDIVPEKCKYQRVIANVWRSVKSMKFPTIADESFAFDESIAQGTRDPYIHGRWVIFRRANTVVLLAHEWFITDAQDRDVTLDLVQRADSKVVSQLVPATSRTAQPSPSSAPQP